ncbi:MAG: DUF255 domain-containing protein [Acidobacteriota bacterium]
MLLTISPSLTPGAEFRKNIRLDLSYPSQELYRDAFQYSVPVVQWSEWSPYAFAKARALDKPILLNIGVRWDKNCYDMDAETFSDPSVAWLINNHFVPIRVDGDKRPDIKKAYGAKIWPSIFFLLPDGRPMIWQEEEGGKYPMALGFVYPNTMKDLILSAFKYYKGHPEKVDELASAQMKTEENALDLKEGPLDQGIPERILSSLKANFDLQNGGFGKEPKFPIPSALEFAVHMYSLEQNPAVLEICSRTLKAIMNSEMNDRLEGGIFRYANRADWSDPAREKLLDRNASLLDNLLDLFMLTGDAEIKNEALSILNYIDKTLLDSGGAFLAGQYADFAFADGYYASAPEEKKFLIRPPIDRRIFCNRSAIAASSFLKASIIMNDQAWFEKGRKAVDFLLEEFYSPGRGVFHFYEKGRKDLIGILEDNAQFCMTLFDLYQISGEELYLKSATEIADFMIDNLKDVMRGGFFDYMQDQGAPGKLKLPMKSIDDNALAARALIRIYHTTGRDKYLREAVKSLELFSTSYMKYEVFASSYGLACSEYFVRPLRIIVIGKSHDQRVKNLISEANRIPEKWKIVKFIDEEKEDISKIGMIATSTPVLYFIKSPLISSPVTNHERVAAQYEKFKKRLSSGRAKIME